MPTKEAFSIVYNSTGFERVHRQQNALTRGARDLTKTVTATSAAYKQLGRVGATLVSFAAITKVIHQVVSLADSFVNMQNRLNVTAESTAHMTHNLGALAEIAKKTRTELSTNVEVFSRFALAGRSQGFSTDQLLVATEALAKAVVISGSTTSEAKGAFIQLSQAFGSTQLRGQELTSVLEQIPRAAEAIAKALDIPIGKLREFGLEGKITSSDILRALIDSSKELEQEFGQTTSTFAQALTVLNNELKIYIGASAEAAGVTSGLVAATNFAAEKIVPELAEALVYAGQAASDFGTSIEWVLERVDKARDSYDKFEDNLKSLKFFGPNVPGFFDQLFDGLTTEAPKTLKDANFQLEKIDYLLRRIGDPAAKEKFRSAITSYAKYFEDGLISADQYATNLESVVEQLVGLGTTPITFTPDLVKAGIQNEIQALQDAAEKFSGIQYQIASAYEESILKYILNGVVIPGVNTRGLNKYFDSLNQEMEEYEKNLQKNAAGQDVLTKSWADSKIEAYINKMRDLEKARAEVQAGIKALAPGIDRLNLTMGEAGSKGLQSLIDGFNLAAFYARSVASAIEEINTAAAATGRQQFLESFGYDLGAPLSFQGLGGPTPTKNASGQVMEPISQGLLDLEEEAARRSAEKTFGSIISGVANAIESGDADRALQRAKDKYRKQLEEFMQIPVEARRAVDPGTNALVEAIGFDKTLAIMEKGLESSKNKAKDYAEEISNIFFDVNPERGALSEIEGQITLLTKALNGGIPGLKLTDISTQDLIETIGKLGEKMNDPLGKFAELNDRITGYRESVMTYGERASKEFKTQMDDIGLAIKHAGINLNDFTNADTIAMWGLIARLTGEYTRNANPELEKLKEQFADLGVDKLAELNDLARAGGADFAAGAIGVDQYRLAMDELQRQEDELSRSFAGGSRRAIRGLTEEYTNGAAQIEGTLVNAFRGAEDALVEFVRTGKFNFADLADSIISDLARIAIQRAILEPLTDILGTIIPGGSFFTQAATTIAGASSASVGGSPASFSAAATSPAAISVAPQVTVNVNAQGSNNPTAIGDAAARAVQQAVEATTRAVVRDELQRLSRPGGQMNNRLREGV